MGLQHLIAMPLHRTARRGRTASRFRRVEEVMRRMVWVSAAALAVAAAYGPALADDPYEKLTPEELAQDRETIRRLNREQLDYVRKRDAGYAEGWRAYARGGRGSASDERYRVQRSEERRGGEEGGS